jgi:hypothetical protein
MYERLNVSNAAGAPKRFGVQIGPSGRILPRSIRIDTYPSLAHAAGAVLSFVGPRRQTTLGIGSREP